MNIEIQRGILEILNNMYPKPAHFGYIAAQLDKKYNTKLKNTTVVKGLGVLQESGEICDTGLMGKETDDGTLMASGYRITPAGLKTLDEVGEG